MFLVDCQLCVASYYPTTPTDYPRGMSVGTPVAENTLIFVDISDF